MKISSKEKTALKVMIYLASHYDEKRYISLKEISENEDISLKYLEKIMILLNKDKKLDVLRGKNGGYKLKYDPKEYTIYDILKNVEADIDKSPCDKTCIKKDKCKMLSFYIGLSDNMNKYMNNYTLYDFITKEE